MANPEHVDWLREGARAWNKRRAENPKLRPMLSKADFREFGLQSYDLSYADLSAADLSGTYLIGANLLGAELSQADLRGADLSGADLRRTNLHEANISGANVEGADLRDSVLSGANLSYTYLQGAKFDGAVLEDVILTLDLQSDPLRFHFTSVIRKHLRNLGAVISSDPSDIDVLSVIVDPGSAPPEEIADILSDLSILYRRMGGSGINFSLQDIHVLEGEML